MEFIIQLSMYTSGYLTIFMRMTTLSFDLLLVSNIVFSKRAKHLTLLIFSATCEF